MLCGVCFYWNWREPVVPCWAGRCERLLSHGLESLCYSGVAELREGGADVGDLGLGELVHAGDVFEEGRLEGLAEFAAGWGGFEEFHAAVGCALVAGQEAALFEPVYNSGNVGGVAAQDVREAAHGAGFTKEENDLGLDGREGVGLGYAFKVDAEALDVGKEQFDDLGLGGGGGVLGSWDP